jgi:hypothetical protein
MKSANLNFLEPSGQIQACDATALPLHLPFIFYQYFKIQDIKGIEEQDPKSITC